MKYRIRGLLIFLVLILFSIQIQSTQSASHPDIENQLTTRVNSVSIGSSGKGNGFAYFEILYEAEIWNRYDTSIEITHSNTCAFHLFIDPPVLEDDAPIYNSIACGEALTLINYPPGLTSITGKSELMIESDSYDNLPDGIYELSLGDPNSWSYRDDVTFVKAYMKMSNGVVDFNSDSIPDYWNTITDKPVTNSESLEVSYPNILLSLSSLVLFIFVKRKTN